jgi:PAS domain S-box-containing protein
MHTLVQWLNEQMNTLTVRSAADLVIALGHIATLLGLIWLLKHCESVLRQHRVVVWLLGSFIFVGALSSLSGSLDFLYPATELRLLAKAVMVVLSVVALAAIWRWFPVLLDLPRPGQFAAENERLRSEAAANVETMWQRASLLQKYKTALKESAVTVFTQDRNLRYTSISNAAFGHEIEQVIGRTDMEILPRESYETIVGMKRQVMQTGKPVDGEVSVGAGDETHWLDFHIEPLTDPSDHIVGLTCAMIDITERKASEDHLRLLMRELTHRSKNLLAVIQSIARQTARHSGSIESFLDQFAARTQALATSHDLLVQESWYGASLSELVRLQLGHYLDHRAPDITMEGPSIVLKPEAAQGLGLALHELATNAAKHGALSTPSGRVTIEWRRLSPTEGYGLELIWTERGGPPVTAPARRGFGSLVIEQNLARSLNADVDLTFAPDGLRCRVRVPLEHIFGGR